MAEKQKPLGICDLCGGEIPPHLGEYTSKGLPRLHCSRGCRNTANSRAGSSERARKARQRVARGEWQNPAILNPPTGEEQARRARLGRRREVEAGTWRNPALDDAAREKLSRPRKHSGPLHQAIEKLSRGQKMTDLTPEQKKAYRRYRVQLRTARRDEVNAYYRRRYHKQQAEMTDEEREAQRAKWREANRRRSKNAKKSSSGGTKQ